MAVETHEIYMVTAGFVFAIGLGGVFLCRHFFRKIIATKMLGAAVFLLFISVSQRDALEAPDPVPHAMVITGIVVAVSASAFALALARRIRAETGRTAFEEEGEP
ncbi:MAG: NADH-quinone oxidoreductase subunit K [Opitutales bacterium]|nr:NADH-quinone oxidoreductase subunit K [Opitutales bacterium]